MALTLLGQAYTGYQGSGMFGVPMRRRLSCHQETVRSVTPEAAIFKGPKEGPMQGPSGVLVFWVLGLFRGYLGT